MTYLAIKTSGFPPNRVVGLSGALDTARLRSFIDSWRAKGLVGGFFEVSSYNSFPTRAGLASSSSGFVALSLALWAIAGGKQSRRALSRLARTGSGSAARSVIGGLAALPLGSDPAARLLAPPENIPWGMVIAVVDAKGKETSSREGMELCRRHSPYYRCWLAQAKRDYRPMLRALANLDLAAVGVEYPHPVVGLLRRQEEKELVRPHAEPPVAEPPHRGGVETGVLPQGVHVASIGEQFSILYGLDLVVHCFRLLHRRLVSLQLGLEFGP